MSEGQGAIDPLHCTIGMPIRFEEILLSFGKSIENNFFMSFDDSYGNFYNTIDRRGQIFYDVPFEKHICCASLGLSPFPPGG